MDALVGVCRVPVELGCCAGLSLLPLHSAVAAARLTSRLSTASSCRTLSQGILCRTYPGFALFVWLGTFSANEQYFSLTTNQPTAVMAYQPSEHHKIMLLSVFAFHLVENCVCVFSFLVDSMFTA